MITSLKSLPVDGTRDLPACPPRPAGQELAPGYWVREHLSRGRVLDVYSGWSAERDCLRIAKTLRPERFVDQASRGQLIREGELLTQLTHPHLVRGYGLVEVPLTQAPIVVLETLTGATLSWLIETQPAPGLEADDVTLLGRQLCSVLHYLHRNQILHLDLKPSNIVCESGFVRLLDLSLAQPPGPCPAGRGTLEYMAPEQLSGGRVTEATDVWGLGGVLYRAVTGRRPFARIPPSAAVDRRIDAAPLVLAPDWLAHLVIACLAPAPAKRPSLTMVRDVLDKG